MIGFTKAIARENARYGIIANAIAPGPIETPLLMGAKEFGEIGEKSDRDDEVLDPDGAARPARGGRRRRAFLVSDDATYVTGETLGVSGGLGMV